MSPTAHIPGMFVSRYASTVTPRSTTMPECSASAVSGRTPMPTTTKSASRFRIDGEWHSVRVSAKRLGVNNGDVLRDAAIAGLGLVALPTFILRNPSR